MALSTGMTHIRLDNESRKALEHQCHLQAMIDTINSSLTSLSDGPIKHKLNNDVQELQKAAEGISAYLSYNVPAKFYNERRPEDLRIAQSVFVIPKLLEIILEHANLKDVLSMCQVSKDFKDIIDGSPKLQMKLGYKAMKHNDAMDCRYALLSPTAPYMRTCPRFWVDTDDNYRSAGNVFARFYSIRPGSALPKLCTAWVRMLVFQPPVYQMMAMLECSAHSMLRHTASVFASETGLTLGDLYAQAEKMLGQEVACPAWQAGTPRRYLRRRGEEVLRLAIDFEGVDVDDRRE